MYEQACALIEGLSRSAVVSPGSLFKGLCPQIALLALAAPIFNTNSMKFSVYSARHPRRSAFFVAPLPVLSLVNSSTFGEALRSSMSLLSSAN